MSYCAMSCHVMSLNVLVVSFAAMLLLALCPAMGCTL